MAGLSILNVRILKQMHKIAAVEEARVLMSEGLNWGVWKWLMEKRRVRQAADSATEALAKANKDTKRTWSEDLHKAYKELVAEAELEEGKPGAKRKHEKIQAEAKDVDPKIKVAIRRVKEADDEAQRATQDAEDMFEEGERRLSTSMAREAAQKALESYDLREKAIRKAEDAARRFASAPMK